MAKKSLADNMKTNFQNTFNQEGLNLRAEEKDMKTDKKKKCPKCDKVKCKCKCEDCGKKLIDCECKIEESATGADSAGAFAGPLSFGNITGTPQFFAKPYMFVSESNKRVIKITEEQYRQLKESTDIISAGNFQYNTPKIWAKNKANWKNASKTIWPGGKRVKVKDKCKYFPYCEILDALIYEGENHPIIESVSRRTGKSKKEILNIIKKNLNK